MSIATDQRVKVLEQDVRALTLRVVELETAIANIQSSDMTLSTAATIAAVRRGRPPKSDSVEGL